MSYTSELTEKDIQNMETFIELVLDDYKLGKLSKSQAISGITHVMVALELDNYTEVRTWFEQGSKLINSVTENVITERLQSGWELSNRGQGWFLSSPSKPDRQSESSYVPDDVIHKMVQDDVLKTIIQYSTGRAELVKTGSS